MKAQIQDRTQKEAEYIVANGATVREAARAFGVSKSALHADIKKRLPQLDAELSKRVAEVLTANFNAKHLRGGEATRQKYVKDR